MVESSQPAQPVDVGTLCQLPEMLSIAGTTHRAQVLLTIGRTVKHAEELDEGNLHVQFREGTHSVLEEVAMSSTRQNEKDIRFVFNRAFDS